MCGGIFVKRDTFFTRSAGTRRHWLIAPDDTLRYSVRRDLRPRSALNHLINVSMKVSPFLRFGEGAFLIFAHNSQSTAKILEIAVDRVAPPSIYESHRSERCRSRRTQARIETNERIERGIR